MSLLVFSGLPSEGYTIYVDTLMTEPDGTPIGCLDKHFVVPHLGLVMATTGLVSLAFAWVMHLFSEAVEPGHDLMDLHPSAPAELRRLYAELLPEGCDQTSTVYHFGLDRSADEFVYTVYRSVDDFAGEVHRLGAGLAAKPAPAGGLDALRAVEPSTDGVIALAEQIRLEQSRLPVDEQVFIGGELMRTELLRHPMTGGAAIVTSPVHTFAPLPASSDA